MVHNVGLLAAKSIKTHPERYKKKLMQSARPAALCRMKIKKQQTVYFHMKGV